MKGSQRLPTTLMGSLAGKEWKCSVNNIPESQSDVLSRRSQEYEAGCTAIG
jgi:hypothetical protein